MYENQTYEAILQRMLDRVPNDVDKREGSIIYDAIAPAAMELAQIYAELDSNINLSFADTASGEFLRRRADESGVTINLATPAERKGLFYDSLNNPFDVPIGSRFSIEGLNFFVKEKLDVGQFILECETAGVVGNQYFGTLLPIENISGLARAELADVLTPGNDEESEESLRQRYLARRRNPSSSGNKADYVNWTLEVPGVGGVSVVPVRDGPGTVSIAIIGADKKPASQELVDSVQNYIASPWKNTVEAETMTIGGSGVSVDNTQTDDTVDSVKMVYDAAGTGTVTKADLHLLLQKPGIWQVRALVKVDDNTRADDLLQIGVWNVSGAAWAKISPSSPTDAVSTFQANDLETTFMNVIQQFYWNGLDQLELRITRLQADTVTTVWVDRVEFRSTFSTDRGDGKAPVGARVTVESATALFVNVSVTLVVAQGYNVTSVRAAAQQAIEDYIRSLAFTDDNDVRYVRIGQAILDTQGVQDYQNLLVNGGTGNVIVGEQEVAVLGTVTWV